MRFAILAGIVGLVAACGSDPLPPAPMGVPPPPGPPTVSGVYNYQGVPPQQLYGTITLEQEGDTVRVLDTSYGNANDRPLRGEATLVGDTLVIQLTPQVGEQNFTADVTFLFSPDRSTFTVGFSDTNGDSGPQGSFEGVRIAY